jgi:hypothetical protein
LPEYPIVENLAILIIFPVNSYAAAGEVINNKLNRSVFSLPPPDWMS